MLICLSALPFTWFTARAEDERDWTGYTPIFSKSQLNDIRNNLTGKYYLTADIVFNQADFEPSGSFYNDGYGWIPIGSAPFQGVLDGNGYTISGLTINNSDTGTVYAGLFCEIGSSGTIRNLHINGGSITASSNVSYSGSITAYNFGTISNCSSNINVTGSYAGGITGYNTGSITDCNNYGNISMSAQSSILYEYSLNIGGIAGISTIASKISNCANFGAIMAELSGYSSDPITSYAGGITGRNLGSLTTCINNGAVTVLVNAKNRGAGGITGENSRGTITECINKGTLSGPYSAGIAAVTNYGYIRDCGNMGNITAYQSAAGISGINDYTAISRCFNSGDIRSTSTIGYSAGISANDNSSIILDCYNTGNINGVYCNGIAGLRGSTSILNCYNIGSVSGTHLGGISSGIKKITTSYFWDIGYLNPETEAELAISRTRDQLIQPTTYAGFDFNTVWEMSENTDYPFPTLRTIAHMEAVDDTTVFDGGNGKLHNPYRITTAAQLNAVRNYMYSSFILENDIVFTEEDYAEGGNFYNDGLGWVPIGTESTSFMGHFNGDGYTITGLKINNNISKRVYAGLFGNTGGTVYNLGMIDGDILITTNYTSYAGMISAYNTGIIHSCYNHNGSVAIISTTNGTYSSSPYVGGIVGYTSGFMKYSLVSNCFNTGTVTAFCSGHDSIAGGIIGSADSRTTIKNSYNAGVVSSTSESSRYDTIAGGIIGISSIDINIKNVYNVGSLTAVGSVKSLGGIIGSGNYNNEGVYSACYYLDNVNIGGGGKGIVGEGKLTEQQMKQMESFVGFDFDTVWEIDGYHNYPYPQLTRVRQEPISGITLDIPPAHRETLEGLYPDLTGTQATVTYKDGYSISVPITAQMLDYDRNQVGLQTVYLTYGGKTSADSFELNVLAKSIVSIDITNLPTKTTYVQGQPIDLSGGTLHIVYNNHTDETVSMTDAVVTDFPNSTGTGTVVISYGGFTETFDIVVNDRVVKTWDILTEPDKIIYLEGDSLDLTGAQIKVIFVSDDDYYEVIPITADMVSGYESTSGQKIITVKFNDTTQTFIVKVNAKSLISISVTTMPAKITYLEGESLNTTDMVVTAYYNNGTNEVVTPDSVTGYTSTPGTKTITVAYQGQVVTFTVTVNAKSLTSILVTTKPTKLIYLEGDSFNNTGMIVTAYYDNGTTEPVIDYTVSGYSSTAGTKTITVSHGGKTATFTVTVNAKSLTSITINRQPTKTIYLEGDNFDTTNMIITAHYNNGIIEVITDYTTDGYDSTPGTKTITVSYGGKTVTFTVTVNAKSLISITVTTKPTKITYIVGDSLSTSGMTVTAYYDNDTSATIFTGLTTRYDFNTAGTKTVTVEYGGKSDTFTVTVNSAVPSSITSSTYIATSTTISKITAGMTVTTLLSGLNEKNYIKVYKGSAEVSGSTKLGTGMTVHLMDGSTIKQTITVIVTGDTNGDGDITITDMIAVKAHLLNKSSLSDVYAKAADTNGDSSISITDFIQAKAHILGKESIKGRAH